MPHLSTAATLPTARRDGLSWMALDSAAFTLAALGIVHLLMTSVLGFNVFAEAFNAGPVALAGIETVLTLSACYVVGLTFWRNT